MIQKGYQKKWYLRKEQKIELVELLTQKMECGDREAAGMGFLGSERG